MQNILLAFGSNLGKRRQTILAAWAELNAAPDIVAVKLSQFYETMPLGGSPRQPKYLNAAGLIQTELAPLPLLLRLQAIERRHGRVRTERWGARTLDIDILLIDDQVVNTPELAVPHPEMLRRRFVLEPATEIAASMTHPIARITLAEALVNLSQVDPMPFDRP